MRKLRSVSIAIFIVLIFFSCGEKVEEFDGFLLTEIEHMLSASSSKLWIKVETRQNGELEGNVCSDSLVYVFSELTGLSVKEKQMFLGFTSCTAQEFCGIHPVICETYESFCEENEDFCEDNPGLIFAGTWTVVEPAVEDGTTNEFIINFPGDTTRYTINYITPQNLEITHVENEGVEIFEKLIHR